MPQWKPSAKIRVLPVDEVPTVKLGAIWRGQLLPITEELLRALRARAGLIKS